MMVHIDDLIGQPFDPENREGYNCYGLCREVCRRMGIALPERESPADPAERSDYIAASTQVYDKLDGPEPGCLVTFRVHPPYVSHVGVMLDTHRFLHVMKKRHVCIERIDNPFWQKRIDGYYRYPDRHRHQPV